MESPASSPLFETVALIGLGLIGSSLARVMKREGLAGKITGCARSEETRRLSLKLGFVDCVEADAAKAVEGADLVVICTPLGAYKAVVETIAPHLKKGAILSDVGSVKGSASVAYRVSQLCVTDCGRWVSARSARATLSSQSSPPVQPK